MSIDKRLDNAVFLDRDGTITEMVYYPEHGLVDSPFFADQLKLTEGAGSALRLLQSLGLRLIVISNQPGIAKGHFSIATHRQICRRLTHLLENEDVRLDGQYYCLHHPLARVAEYRLDCDCRKPRPGLLLRAAEDQGIRLCDSMMIGDGLTDIVAGKRAGTKTILVGNTNSLTNRLIVELDAQPTFLARSLIEAAVFVQGLATREPQSATGLSRLELMPFAEVQM